MLKLLGCLSSAPFFDDRIERMQLPGEPSNIVALGGGKAEMTTSSGAIYYTKNAGMNWSAQVRGSRGRVHKRRGDKLLYVSVMCVPKFNICRII